MPELPVGAIIAFGGTLADAQAQQANGWWICDGRMINDFSSPLHGKLTPDVRNRFLILSSFFHVGAIGGRSSYLIPPLKVKSHTTGEFGPPNVYGDPFTHMQGAHTWNTGESIYSEGTWEGAQVPTIPPFFTVIYLIKVK